MHEDKKTELMNIHYSSLTQCTISVVNSTSGSLCWNYATATFYSNYAGANVCCNYTGLEVLLQLCWC